MPYLCIMAKLKAYLKMKKVFENRGYYNEIIKDAIKNAERI